MKRAGSRRGQASAAESAAPPDPSDGARRRESLLLAGYVVLVIIGFWSVLDSELSTQEPAASQSGSVAAPTQTPPTPAR